MTFVLQGIGTSKGIAIGKVTLISQGQPEIEEYFIPPSERRREIQRYRKAWNAAKNELAQIKSRIPKGTASDVAAFIDSHLLMLEDSALNRVPVDLIRQRGCNSEWALKMQRDAIVRVFDAIEDEYLRTRKDDVDYVVNRVLMSLSVGPHGGRQKAGKPLHGQIVCADDLSPEDTVLMQHHGIAGVITEHGGPLSHTAILARSLSIPAVVGLHAARQYLLDDEELVLDGSTGVVIAEPTKSMVRYYRSRQRRAVVYESARKKLTMANVATTDGKRVRLSANVELPEDVSAAVRVGAQGVGLYRTEYLFMNRKQLPDEREQLLAYTKIVSALKGAPVTIRTLDLGADKHVDGMRPGAPVTTNPALGVRAIRLCLRDPDLFVPQIRAIMRASATGPVRLMIPMLSNVQELFQVKNIISHCAQDLNRDGLAFDPDMPIGAMIEVPAAALCADHFARHVDFLSIGTNDLIQYTIAIDRIDDEVNYLYDPMHPAVLKLVMTTIRAANKNSIPVAMCGEMAGDTSYTRLLLGMGLREFSVHPNALLEVKQIINQSHYETVRKKTQRILRTMKKENRAALLDDMNTD